MLLLLKSLHITDGLQAYPHITERLRAVFVDGMKVVFFTESGLLVDTQDPSLEYCMKGLDFLRNLLQRTLECQEGSDHWVAEGKGRESQRGQGPRRHLQRLDCHPEIASHNKIPNHDSPTNTLTPASSIQTDSGYGTTSPTGSADLYSLPTTSPRQDFSPCIKRR